MSWMKRSSSLPSLVTRECVIQRKSRERLGLRIHSEPDTPGCIIQGVVRGSAADKSKPRVEVDDIILAVNGIKSATLTHPEVVTLLHNAGDRFTLKVANEAEYRESIVVKKGKGAMSKLLSKVTNGGGDSSSSGGGSGNNNPPPSSSSSSSSSKRATRQLPTFATKPPPVGLAASDTNPTGPNNSSGGNTNNSSSNNTTNNTNNNHNNNNANNNGNGNNNHYNTNNNNDGAGPAIMPPYSGHSGNHGNSGDGDDGGSGDGAATNEERAALFAQLLRVPLPATYECIGVSRGGAKHGSCAVHREPTIEAEKIGLFWPGEEVRVTRISGGWLFVDHMESGLQGWVDAGWAGSQHMRPIITTFTYPWQRARGSALYDSVLAHRRKELAELDLASSDALLEEWTMVVAELDASLRLKAKCDAMGIGIVQGSGRGMGGRQRSRSFLGSFRRGKKQQQQQQQVYRGLDRSMPVMGGGDGLDVPGELRAGSNAMAFGGGGGGRQIRSRSRSFHSQPSGQQGSVAQSRHQGTFAPQPMPTEASKVRQRWQDFMAENAEDELDAKTHALNKSSLFSKSNHYLGRRARQRNQTSFQKQHSSPGRPAKASLDFSNAGQGEGGFNGGFGDGFGDDLGDGEVLGFNQNQHLDSSSNRDGGGGVGGGGAANTVGGGGEVMLHDRRISGDQGVEHHPELGLIGEPVALPVATTDGPHTRRQPFPGSPQAFYSAGGTPDSSAGEDFDNTAGSQPTTSAAGTSGAGSGAGSNDGSGGGDGGTMLAGMDYPVTPPRQVLLQANSFSTPDPVAIRDIFLHSVVTSAPIVTIPSESPAKMMVHDQSMAAANSPSPHNVNSSLPNSPVPVEMWEGGVSEAPSPIGAVQVQVPTPVRNTNAETPPHTNGEHNNYNGDDDNGAVILAGETPVEALNTSLPINPPLPPEEQDQEHEHQQQRWDADADAEAELLPDPVFTARLLAAAEQADVGAAVAAVADTRNATNTHAYNGGGFIDDEMYAGSGSDGGSVNPAEVEVERETDVVDVDGGAEVDWI